MKTKNNAAAVGFLVGAFVLVAGGQAHALTVSGSAGAGLQLGATSSVTATVQASTTAGGVASGTASDSASVAAEALIDQPMPITTSADLATYDDLVVKARPVVTAINVDNTNNNIAIQYSQPAKLFGIFPATILGEVKVDAQGNAAVSLPWWSMFYTKDTAAVQASVTGAVSQSGATFDSTADAQTKLQNSARVIDAVTGALQAQAVADASTSATVQ